MLTAGVGVGYNRHLLIDEQLYYGCFLIALVLAPRKKKNNAKAVIGLEANPSGEVMND